jgi:RNA polymerase sigma-70 factor (ECF subfamily)
MVSERIPRLHELADEELMAQYARGEEAGFEILLHRYKRPLFGFLYRYLGRADKAEDVFQDVFYEVIRARKRFRPNQKFAHWLFRIARNRAVDRLRRNGFREMPSLDDPLETGGQGGHTKLNAVAMRGPDPEELTQALELEEALEEALASLPPEQSEVFWLKEKSGLTLAEIAQMVGVAENTVKSRLRYALEKIRTAMMQKGFLP